MYIALDDYKEMYAESCMKRGESLSVNGLKEFIAARRECGKCEDGDYSSIMTGPDGEQRQEYIVCPYCLKLINDSMQYLGNWQDKDQTMNEKWLLVIGLIGITLFALAGMWTQSN